MSISKIRMTTQSMSRRGFIRKSVTVGGITLCAAALGAGCSVPRWRHAVRDIRRPPVISNEKRQLFTELVRMGTLASNSHNAQAWTFAIDEEGISIFPDFSRSLPVVDPTYHHLFVSLGCAAENIVQAAPSLGFQPIVNVSDSSGTKHIRIALQKNKATHENMALTIPKRSCSRSTYDGNSVGRLALARLAGAADDDVNIDLLFHPKELTAVSELVIAANTCQVNNAAYREELKSWIRFNKRQAYYTRDGIFAAASGSPTAPPWIARLVFDRAYTAKNENEKLRAQMASTPCVGVFTVKGNTWKDWINVGRVCQRLSLYATAMNIAHAHVNQPIEVSSVRRRLASLLGRSGSYPDLVMRIGYGPSMPRSLRRPVHDVLQSPVT
ncbi:MAG: Tat pathway signal protein [Deltaproteobacteria bacterium]|nr:Tat pathway signal protein [Deltaproteobacteria bacterium]